MNSTNKKLSFAFFGTPELIVPILDELHNNGYIPAVIVTMPDRPQGRKMIVTPPPAKLWALAHNIPVLQPEKLDADFNLQLSTYNLQLGLVVAYGKILPQELLYLFPKGMINVHYSLLPKYRGATPVESAILTGDEKTGVTIQQIEWKLDSGPIIKSEETEIETNETAPELRDRLNEMAKSMLIETLEEIENNTIKILHQNEEEATFCKKIHKEDALVDIEAEPPSSLWKKYRAYYGWPGIFFIHPSAGRIKIKKAHFLDGQFIIERVVPEGKKEMDYETFKKSVPIIS